MTAPARGPRLANALYERSRPRRPVVVKDTRRRDRPCWTVVFTRAPLLGSNMPGARQEFVTTDHASAVLFADVAARRGEWAARGVHDAHQALRETLGRRR